MKLYGTSYLAIVPYNFSGLAFTERLWRRHILVGFNFLFPVIRLLPLSILDLERDPS